MAIRGDHIAQGFEQPVKKCFSAAAGKNSDANFQWEFHVGEFLFRFAAAPESSAKDAGERDAREGGRDVRTIVDVLVEKTPFAGRAAGFSNEFDGIDFEQKSCSAACLCGFGIKDVRLAKRE